MPFEIVEDREQVDREFGSAFVYLNDGDAEPELPDEWEYDHEPEESFDAEYFEERRGSLIGVTPSRFVEFAIMLPDKESNTYKRFDFSQRRYLRQIYDTPSIRTLLKCGRQVEKSCGINTCIRLFNGAPIKAGNVKVGDWLASMSNDGSRMTYGKVTWVSRRYFKPCRRIKSRQGHSTEIALTHPMRVWDAWKEAGNITIGDVVAVGRRIGEFFPEFSNKPEYPRHRIRLTAYLIGDGGTGGSNEAGRLRFSQMPGPVLDEFVRDVDLSEAYCKFYKTTSKAHNIIIKGDHKIRSWLEQDGLMGHTSHTKFVPYWVWGLSREDTVLFINRLWATDGHVKKNAPGKYSIEYCSVSNNLIRDVQALLWKFGIPSSIRKNWPNYWKNQSIEKYANILRIETQKGIFKFLTEIGALGKSENIEPPSVDENNNRDTYPVEINKLIKRIIDSRGNSGRFGVTAEKGKSLRTAGLRETLKYPPTSKKLQQYVDFFKSDIRYDQRLVAELEKHIDTDLYWDEVEEIEDIGEQECVDFEVEGTHNFVCDGFITHNSTLLGNKLLSYSCINSAMNCLYVSPTNLQTKTFSNDRLREPIETSPYLKAWTTSKLVDSISLKKFINRSQITLRYAFLNADRCRGIPSDIICLDEVQDLLTDNIAVIEQCASHSVLNISGKIHKGGIFMYSGTPKSLDNTLEFYWQNQSTQNEWAVPCHRHAIQTGNKVSSVYWNILDEDNIGLKGVVCDKCHNPIDVADMMAQWVSLNPGILKSATIKTPFEGFRIPQLMVPWISHNAILQNQATYSRATFYNEVLGLSYDSGTRPLTQQDVIDNCDSRLLLTHEYQNSLLKFLGAAFPVYAGIDWGCHDEKTRVLTSRGFVFFKDLTDKDQVAQWDPETRDMTFVVPKVRTVRDWNQPLLHFKAKGLDMMLTSTHRMRVSAQQDGNWGRWLTESANDTSQRGGNVKFIGFVEWKGEEKEVFELPGIPKSSGYSGSVTRLFRMDGWLQFLGFYLSEGGLALVNGKPTCIKMSQRETVNFDTTQKIRDCFRKNDIEFSEFPNPKTGDINWTIHGKQFWLWLMENVGLTGDAKRIPRIFMGLSKRQLQILFDAMMLGDGSVDPRPGNNNGCYYSTSKGLCEDFQELCIKLGLRSTLSLHKPAEGNRKTRWRVSWSFGRDFHFNTPNQRIEKIPYRGQVYCCSVPTGYIVTERNGRISYQGNTGENSYTVISLGAYMADGRFTIFYVHRFEGREAEPQVQIEEISNLMNKFRIRLAGCDYGGGFWPNDELTRRFGFQRVPRYQYAQHNSTKVVWQPGLSRFLVHRTEVMSDVFNAIKRRNVFRFPNWEQFQTPFGSDMLSIFSEYNEQIRQNVYKKSPNNTDDTFHSVLLCFLASMIHYPRPDVIAPNANHGRPPKNKEENN